MTRSRACYYRCTHDIMLTGPAEAISKLKAGLADDLKIKWTETLPPDVVADWVNYLGKQWRTTPTGMQLRISPYYMDQVLQLLHLEHGKPVSSPMLAATRATESDPELSEEEHHLYRT
eukprot:14570984-Heterocapsa_arctica.AAC.1